MVISWFNIANKHSVVIRSFQYEIQIAVNSSFMLIIAEQVLFGIKML